MGRRRQARELALQVLFHMEFNPGDPGESLDLISRTFLPNKAVQPFTRQLVTGVWERREELDGLIRRASEHWRLERMSLVDRNLLRMALFEVLFMEDVPHKVSIDEAVQLGKTYGSEESGGFINGILDHIYQEMQKESERERSA